MAIDPPESFVDYALQSIRRELADGRIRPGDRLAAGALAARLRISHIPVREALRFLEAEGQLVRDGRRLRVATLTASEAEDIYLTRKLLEEDLIALGIPRLGKEHDETLRSLVQQMESAARNDDHAVYHSLTRQFHFLPFEAAGRPWVVRFLRTLWDASARYQRPLFDAGGWKSHHLDHHRGLLDALLARDVAGVNTILHHHRQWLVDEVRALARETEGAADLAD